MKKEHFMGRRVTTLVLLVCNSVFFHQNEAESRATFSREDLKLEEDLERMNKPHVKTIHTKYGDIYDCVDFYQQPSFDHPSLKNHNFHPGMRPTIVPKMLTPRKDEGKLDSIKSPLEGGGCPFGTVPIRRTTKDDLVRSKMYPQMFNSKSNIIEQLGTHHAIVRISKDIAHHGAGGDFNYYNLSVIPPQYTSGQVKVTNGDESVIAGWTVNAGLYPDTRTRMFAYTNAGQTHCFNTRCGFIQVNDDYPVDSVLERLSTYGGQQIGTQFSIYHDIVNRNWFYMIEEGIVIGFWPHQIFTNLGEVATRAEWGGEAFSPPGVPGPGMGSGHMPISNTNYDGFSRNTNIVVNNTIIDPYNLETFVDDLNYFQVIDRGNVGKLHGYLIDYGGKPGVVV